MVEDFSFAKATAGFGSETFGLPRKALFLVIVPL